MAKRNNANSELYKKLHEEYDLQLDVDFYLHPQSGSYIIKHNAVKKIVAKQRERGFIVETPMAQDIIYINDGTKEGIHGKEVVVAGNFYLKTKDGNVVDKVYKTGEVNVKNCKNAYPHTMALKRMYDRGVLDLLRFAEEGLYSDVEADDFKQSAARRSPAKQQEPQVAAVAPKPQLPPKPVVRPTVMPPLPEKKTPQPEVKEDPNDDLRGNVLEFLRENPDGVSKTQIWNVVPQGKEEIDAVIDQLVESKEIYKSGMRRGTKYHLQEKAASETTGMTKAEYNTLWREASEGLRAKGIDYSQMMRIVNEVTGHDTAISAFNAGTLTKQHIAEITNRGTQLGA